MSNDVNRLDRKTKYDLLLYDFIQDDFYKNPWANIIHTSKTTSPDNDSFVDYCLFARTNLYIIAAIKRKVDCLPDNNLFMPTMYSSIIMNKKLMIIERPGNTVSKMLYNLLTKGKQK